MTAQEIADKYCAWKPATGLLKEIEAYAAERVADVKNKEWNEAVMAAASLAVPYIRQVWKSSLSDETRSMCAAEFAAGFEDGLRAMRKEILSLKRPKPPVWQHREGCPTPYQWMNGLWQYQKGGPLSAYCHTDHEELRFCPGCGAEKPEVTR